MVGHNICYVSITYPVADSFLSKSHFIETLNNLLFTINDEQSNRLSGPIHEFVIFYAGWTDDHFYFVRNSLLVFNFKLIYKKWPNFIVSWFFIQCNREFLVPCNALKHKPIARYWFRFFRLMKRELQSKNEHTHIIVNANHFLRSSKRHARHK